MKAALFFLFLLLPCAQATSLGASPVHLQWDDFSDKTILLFNPEPFAQSFTIEPAKSGLFKFSETSGTIGAGETRRIKARPSALRTTDSLIYISVRDQKSFFEPSLALHASIRAPPPITANIIGALGGLPAKAALIAIGSLLLAWCYLRLRKK